MDGRNKGSNNWQDKIVLHVFQIHQSAPDLHPVEKNKWEKGEQIGCHSLLKFGLIKLNNIFDNTTWEKLDLLEAKFMALINIASCTIKAVSKMNIVQKEISNKNKSNNNE